MKLTAIAALCAFFAAMLGTSHADDRKWITSSTLIGPSKYEGGFTHYDYVNPNAPKGGTMNRTAAGSFDSFNPFIVQGAPAAGLNYQGGLLWDNLMAKGLDEAASAHPLIAEAYTHPDDYSQATYRLNPNARWHDGKPITVEDVIWSMEQMKEHSPQWNRYFANVIEMKVEGEREITFIFDQKNNRELPVIIGDLPVVPKHWWTGKDANGKDRDFARPTLEPPLGSGPYKIASFSAGSKVVWERVKDYWAADLPVNKGRYNVDNYSYVYFQDSNAQWEAFKKGGFEDYRFEGRPEKWANEYNFPAVEQGLVKKEIFTPTSGYTIAMYYMNTRREKFKDPRVRKALTWAFNFEEMNEQQFFNLYQRSDSFFGGTELASSGLPSARELEILEPYRGQIPDEVFTEEFKLPAYKTRRDERTHLKTAFDLLKEAGWERKGTQLVNAKGEPFEIEMISFNPASERRVAPWIINLKKLGIDAKFRLIDRTQYIARLNDFDFDIVGAGTAQSMSPGNEQREYWSSKAADQPGSRNLMGAKNPAIDELVEKLIYAKDRQELVDTTRALERVLLFSYYAVPAGTSQDDWFGIWDKIVIPKPQPAYYGFDPFSWWIDTEKEATMLDRLK